MRPDLRDVPEPLILNLAPTGMVPTRSMSPHVPLQPDEVVHDVAACAEVGVTVVHVHARDNDGLPTSNPDVYARIIGQLRNACPDLVVCVSCSGRNGFTLEQRAAVLDLTGELRPDFASLTLSSLNFPGTASVNEPETVVELASRMQARGIVPELEVFDLGMANMVRQLARKGLIRPPFMVNVLFGNLATAQARLGEVAALIGALPEGSIITLAGLGPAQLPIAALGATAADGVRIGLEDNLWLDQGRTEHATNRGLVEWVHDMASMLGRPVMSPKDLRARLGIERK